MHTSEVYTKGSVTVCADGADYCSSRMQPWLRLTLLTPRLLAQTSPTIILGTKNLAEALSAHEQVVSRSCSFTTTLHICRDQQSLPPSAPSAALRLHRNGLKAIKGNSRTVSAASQSRDTINETYYKKNLKLNAKSSCKSDMRVKQKLAGHDHELKVDIFFLSLFLYFLIQQWMLIMSRIKDFNNPFFLIIILILIILIMRR